ncbi:putative SP-containing protein [Vairimorpha necatrix]|uniref:SP-containing protein n=1 Tax=Vairimorpha necatrix TaxID=6039 RepID=A0AAX4J866_9MICR
MKFFIFYITAILTTYNIFIVSYENNIEIYMNIKQKDQPAIYFISDYTVEECVKDSINIKRSDLEKPHINYFFKPLTLEEKDDLYDILNFYLMFKMKDKAKVDLFKRSKLLLMVKIPYIKNKICIDRVTTVDLLTANTYSRSKVIEVQKKKDFYKLEFADSYDYNENYSYPLLSSSYQKNLAIFNSQNLTEILLNSYFNMERN